MNSLEKLAKVKEHTTIAEIHIRGRNFAVAAEHYIAISLALIANDGDGDYVYYDYCKNHQLKLL